jgi:hypothetical protein
MNSFFSSKTINNPVYIPTYHRWNENSVQNILQLPLVFNHIYPPSISYKSLPPNTRVGTINQPFETKLNLTCPACGLE